MYIDISFRHHIFLSLVIKLNFYSSMMGTFTRNVSLLFSKCLAKLNQFINLFKIDEKKKLNKIFAFLFQLLPMQNNNDELRRKRHEGNRPNHILLFTIINPVYPINVVSQIFTTIFACYVCTQTVI